MKKIIDPETVKNEAELAEMPRVIVAGFRISIADMIEFLIKFAIALAVVGGAIALALMFIVPVLGISLSK